MNAIRAYLPLWLAHVNTRENRVGVCLLIGFAVLKSCGVLL